MFEFITTDIKLLILFFISSKTPLPCKSNQPVLHPGLKYFFDKPEHKKMGTHDSMMCCFEKTVLVGLHGLLTNIAFVPVYLSSSRSPILVWQKHIFLNTNQLGLSDRLWRTKTNFWKQLFPNYLLHCRNLSGNFNISIEFSYSFANSTKIWVKSRVTK